MKIIKASTEQLDTLEDKGCKHITGHGKNFKPLVAAGSWVVSGFMYGSSHCACCGRPICRILKLKNLAHEAAKQKDENYAFPEEIGIGVVCGPKVFQESCVGYYDDPAREWERQHNLWKTYIKYVMACVKNKDVWECVPRVLREATDRYLDTDQSNDPHSGNWWLVRDAKRLLLERTKRTNDEEKKPVMWDLRQRCSLLLRKMIFVKAAPKEWFVTTDCQIDVRRAI